MKTVHQVLPLFTLALTLALGATLAQARPPSAPGLPAPRDAINPQPLPPRHDRPQIQQAINPQPLPPERGGARAGEQPRSMSRPYIGETEKN